MMYVHVPHTCTCTTVPHVCVHYLLTSGFFFIVGAFLGVNTWYPRGGKGLHSHILAL